MSFTFQSAVDIFGKEEQFRHKIQSTKLEIRESIQNLKSSNDFLYDSISSKKKIFLGMILLSLEVKQSSKELKKCHTFTLII